MIILDSFKATILHNLVMWLNFLFSLDFFSFPL
jgi:hypothetical protein